MPDKATDDGQNSNGVQKVVEANEKTQQNRLLENGPKMNGTTTTGQPEREAHQETTKKVAVCGAETGRMC